MIDATNNPLPQSVADASSERLVTVPNVLCAIRLVGSLGIIPLALAELPLWVLGLFLTLSATDWLDGKLAVWLDQRSKIGPRLDSVADAFMYAAVLFAGIWLKWQVLFAEWIWIAAALMTYVASWLAAQYKFRRIPSYHTRTAKTAWLLMVVATLALFLDWSIWPLRIATLGVVVANLEAILITILLPAWHCDVISFARARRLRKSRLQMGAGEEIQE